MSEQSNRNFRNHVVYPLIGASLICAGLKLASSDQQPFEQNKGCVRTPVEAGSDILSTATTDATLLEAPVATDTTLQNAINWAAAHPTRLDGASAMVQPGQPVETCITSQPLNLLGTWAVNVTVYPLPNN